MITIDHKGLRCYCDGYRTSAGYFKQLVFVSLYGDHNAVRAVWAHAQGDGRSRYRRLELGDAANLALGQDVKYLTLRRPLGHQRLHLVMLHPDATAQVSPFAAGFALVGTDPARQYWARFARMCPVPMRPAWRETIWSLGLAHGAIEALPGFGLPGYRVDADAETWAPLVAGALACGGLA